MASFVLGKGSTILILQQRLRSGMLVRPLKTDLQRYHRQTTIASSRNLLSVNFPPPSRSI